MSNKPPSPSIWVDDEGIFFVTDVDEDHVYYLYLPLGSFGPGYGTATKFKNTHQIWQDEVIASGVTMLNIQ